MSAAPLATGQRRVVLVLGFHRSGTSMVTRMLNLMGVDLGNEDAFLPPTDRDNARGYWEPGWMNDINEEILTTLGSGTFKPFRPEQGWQRSPELEPLRERARALLGAHFSEAPVWGWKDPRTSLTLPFWRDLVDAPLSCIICVRSPADAVASALKRGVEDIPRWVYAERWLQYTALALSHTVPDERLLVFYDDALGDAAGETRRLATFLGVTEPSGEQFDAAIASVDPGLRHHTTSPWDVAVDTGLPIEARALYLLLRARRALEAPAGHSATQARLQDAIERVGSELRETHWATLETHAALRETELALHESECKEGEAQQEVARLLAELDRGTAELRERDTLVAQRDGAIAELKAALSARDASLATVTGSRSWRLTRPLRTLAKRNARLRR